MLIHFRLATRENFDLVRAVMTHPEVYPAISDDYSPEASAYKPVDHPSILYVFAFHGMDLMGLWVFEAKGVCWEVHTCLLPGHGFKHGREAAKLMAEWIWKNTPCRRIITNVPRFNRAALVFAKAAGMTKFGVNEASYMKHGELHDQIMLGLSKPEKGNTCQQQ